MDLAGSEAGSLPLPYRSAGSGGSVWWWWWWWGGGGADVTSPICVNCELRPVGRADMKGLGYCHNPPLCVCFQLSLKGRRGDFNTSEGLQPGKSARPAAVDQCSSDQLKSPSFFTHTYIVNSQHS